MPTLTASLLDHRWRSSRHRGSSDPSRPRQQADTEEDGEEDRRSEEALCYEGETEEDAGEENDIFTSAKL
jgi:hypothetical protein